MNPKNDAPALSALRVLAHPLRLRLLSLLTGSAMSAADAARDLGDTQANVSYHLRRLHAAGLIDVVETVSVRGGKAKRYRHDPAVGERIDLQEPGGFALLMTAMAEELQRRAMLKRPASPVEFTDAEFILAPADWQRVQHLAHELGVFISDAALPNRSTASTASLPTGTADRFSESFGTGGVGPSSATDGVRIAATVALFELSESPDAVS